MRPNKSVIHCAAGTPGKRSLLARVGAQNPAFGCRCCSLLRSSPSLPERRNPPPPPVVSGQAIYSLTQQFLAVAPKRFNAGYGSVPRFCGASLPPVSAP
jgi:hypothetical protein